MRDYQLTDCSFFRTVIACCLLIGVLPTGVSAQPREAHRTTELIWFTRPGSDAINEGLPLGNGRMGMLINGAVNNERLVLNEDSVWSGRYCEDANNPRAAEALEDIRALFFGGHVEKANQLVLHTQVPGDEPRDPRVEGDYGSYQMLAALHLDFDHSDHEDYYRYLDLDQGVAGVHYRVGGTRFRREAFASHPDQVMLVRLTADGPGSLSFRAGLARPQSPVTIAADAEGGLLTLVGHMVNRDDSTGLRYATVVHVEVSDGVLSAEEDGFWIQDASEVILRIGAATNYAGLDAWPDFLSEEDPLAQVLHTLEPTLDRSYDELKRDHVADHQALFRRTRLELLDRTEGAELVPTNLRLNHVMGGGVDPVLSQLYFNFGKYLLIASSRPRALPANLQGLWADAHYNAQEDSWGYYTPWNGDYHTNINVQMNYWPVEVLNLPECAEPLMDLIRGMVGPGSETARIQHGCSGWTVHTLHNVWGSTVPGGWATWGHFPMAGPWMVTHLWEHYLHSRDRAFLKNNWKVVEGSVRFVLDWLVEDPSTGLLVSGPSASPENRYALEDGTEGYFCMGPTMDQMIAWHIFHIVRSAAEVIPVDEELMSRVNDAWAKLKLPEVGPDGRLLEWAEPYGEPEPGHRHISHLYGLHPGVQITHQSTPEWIEASRKSLEHRLAHGGGHTGWSRAWVINFWARLHDGEQAHLNLLELLRHSTLPNLFDTHPPFQIDGNFGAVAGIAEMLLQSHESSLDTPVLRLLPALPMAWPDGSVRGFRARGDVTIDMDWQNGSLQSARLTSASDQVVHLLYLDQITKLSLEGGLPILWEPDLPH